MESDIKRRLKEFINTNGITVRGFEKSLGRSNGYFKNSEFALPKLISEIAESYPKLNIGWLVSGEGSMEKGGATFIADTVPVVDMLAVGGTLTEQLDSSSINSLECVQTPVKGAEMAIDVSGDSMEPEYPKGARLFCRRIDDLSFIEWGKVYVLDTTQGAIVKEIQPGGNEGTFICKSINAKRYKPFEIPVSSVRGLWRILAVLILK